MGRTLSVSDETNNLLLSLAARTDPPMLRGELIRLMALQYAADTGAMPRVRLPVDRPDNLSEREWRVLVLRCEGCVSLERAGKIFGVTRERIRQIQAKALRKHPEYRVAWPRA